MAAVVQRNATTHQRMLDAARELFLRQGYESTQVVDIIRVADVSRATFYAHFASKDAVMRELITQLWDGARQLYQDFGNLPDWSEESISRWLNGALDSFARNAEISEFVVTAKLTDITPQIAARGQRNVAALMSAPEKWQHFEPGEAERRARLLIYLNERSLVEWVSGRWPQPREALLKTLTDIWRTTLRPHH